MHRNGMAVRRWDCVFTPACVQHRCLIARRLFTTSSLQDQPSSSPTGTDGQGTENNIVCYYCINYYFKRNHSAHPRKPIITHAHAGYWIIVRERVIDSSFLLLSGRIHPITWSLRNPIIYQSHCDVDLPSPLTQIPMLPYTFTSTDAGHTMCKLSRYCCCR
jgi:hypothetical protein